MQILFILNFIGKL